MAIGNAGKTVAATNGDPRSNCAAVYADGATQSHDTSRIAWAKLRAKITEALPLVCPVCCGDIRLIASGAQLGRPPAGAGSLRTGGSQAGEGQDGFARVKQPLAHVGEPVEPPPVSPARGPPTEWTELIQVHDDRDIVQASPDELPVIDIHSL